MLFGRCMIAGYIPAIAIIIHLLDAINGRANAVSVRSVVLSREVLFLIALTGII